MSNIETLTQNTLKSRLVMEVLEEQTGNLTRERFNKGSAYHQLYDQLTTFASTAVRLVYEKKINMPNIEAVGWRKNFSNETAKVSNDAGLKNEIQNFISKTSFPKAVNVPRGLMEYSLAKIAMYTTQVSVMIAFGLDPELLVMSDEEIYKSQIDLTAALIKKGTLTIIV